MNTPRRILVARILILLLALYVGALSLHALLFALHARAGVPAIAAPLAGAELLGCLLFAWPRTMWAGALLLSLVFVIAIVHHAVAGHFPLPILAYLLLTLVLARTAKSPAS